MKTILVLFSLLVLYVSDSHSQMKMEEDIEIAFQNAKKGIYWALNNIPLEKSRLENDLVADDKLYCNVKLYNEVNGVKIESTGYNNSNHVTIKLYRSKDSLQKDGYLEIVKEE